MKSVNVEKMPAPNTEFERGLVVGKFCPLHCGHELLIDAALGRCREVIIISYSKPEFSGYERERRELWLQKRFPQTCRLIVDDDYLQTEAKKRGLGDIPLIPDNNDSADAHRVFVGWLCHYFLQCQVDAVFTSEDYGDGFAEVLSRYFKKHNVLQQHKAVRHICVDKARVTVPVSGTLVRSDIHGYRQCLAAEVYADFVERVCFLGGESSGKTTLAAAMAEDLNTSWVPEYGRELWERKRGVLNYYDMKDIGKIQIEHERQMAMKANRWLFCDTSPLTTVFYSQDMFGCVEADLQTLGERQYQYVFLCAPDIDFVQDNTRRDDAFRQRQHQWYMAELNRKKIPFYLLVGDLVTRMATVKRKLGM